MEAGMQIIAIYVFRNPSQADHALEHLWRNFSCGMERSAGSEVWIKSDIENPRLAGQICESLGGVLK
jgi:hypothetical protein